MLTLKASVALGSSSICWSITASENQRSLLEHRLGTAFLYGPRAATIVDCDQDVASTAMRTICSHQLPLPPCATMSMRFGVQCWGCAGSIGTYLHLIRGYSDGTHSPCSVTQCAVELTRHPGVSGTPVCYITHGRGYPVASEPASPSGVSLTHFAFSFYILPSPS